MKKLPPIEKIPEAWTAIVDQRITFLGDKEGADGQAEIHSSDRAKTYLVTWNAQGQYASDDNATYWRGYAGYPVLAVMMLQGRLPYNETVAWQFNNINWTALNASYKADYHAALQHLIDERHLDQDTINAAMADVMQHLSALEYTVKRLRR